MWIHIIGKPLINRLGCLFFALAGVSTAAVADGSASAAEIDWQSWDALPARLQDQVPAHCGGIYRPPVMDADVSGTDDDTPINITSRFARYRMDEFMQLDGDVRIRQGRMRASGDEATYDQATGEIDLEGNVISRGQGFLLTGEEAQVRDQGDEIKLNTATLLLHGSHIRGEAHRLRRTGDESMRISYGAITSCQPGRNDWSLAATTVDLDRETGTGTARNVRLRIMDWPVFYLPWITFPIDDRRKSGFLTPSFGSSNTGTFASTPYYFNLAPHYDMTYTPRFVSGRGLLSELEGRYLGPYGPSQLELGFINNDDEFASQDPGNDPTRWAVRFDNRSVFSNNWRGTADVAAVSDDDYVEDFDNTLDIQQETRLRREGRINYSASALDFSAMVRGFQTIDETIPNRSRPYKQLPRLRLNSGESMGNWRWRVDNEYNYFTRDNEGLSGLDAAVGHRLRSQPEIGWELNGPQGFLRSSVMLDHTQYKLNDVANNERFSRSVPFYDADAGLVFDRFFTLADTSWNQTLEPRMYYVFSPERDQSDIPSFDSSVTSFNFNQLFVRDRFTGGDRVGDNNRLTTALTSRFFDRGNGTERARISVGRVERFDVQRVGLPNGRGRSGEGSSPLAGEFVLRPLGTLSMRVTGEWDETEQETVRGNSRLRYRSRDGQYILNASHTYDADSELEQAEVSTVFPVGNQTSLIGSWLYDMDNDETEGALAGIEYTSCCWSVQFAAQRFRRDDNNRGQKLDTRLLFQIQLRGLGGGGGATATVREEVPGFEQRGSRFSQPPMNELRRSAESRWP